MSSSITNPASVVDDGANGVDPVPGNNTDDDIDTVDATPELVVIKDDGATQRAAGETFDYTIAVVNNGDQAATGVTVVDTLPAILTADSCPATPVPCTIDNTAGTVTWNVGNLNGGADQLPPAAGSSITLTVTVTVDDIGCLRRQLVHQLRACSRRRHEQRRHAGRRTPTTTPMSSMRRRTCS